MKAEQLKKSILQLAISGKLIKQSSFDEPASIFLQKIKADKQELIKQGKLKKEKELPPIAEEEKPFDIPENWEWVRYCDVAFLHTGNSINTEEKQRKFASKTSGYNYIATKDVRFDTSIDYKNGIKIPFTTGFEVAKAKSAILCIEGGSSGKKVALLNQDVCFGNKLCAFEAITINHLYLFYSLQTSAFIEIFNTKKSGMIGGVGVNSLKMLLLPLPPLAEQQRIVDKIERLLPLIDKYGTYEKELSILEKNLQESLKKSILQYAIQGKLVPQITAEEPASVLLEKIYAEKQELIKRGKIKKEKPLSPIEDSEKPFDIPDSWQWARLGNVILLKSGRDLEPSEYSSKILKYPYITGASCFQGGKLFVNRWTNKAVAMSNLNDLLITCKGTIGDMAFNTIGDSHIARQVMAIKAIKVDNLYLKIFLTTTIRNLQAKANSMIPGISRENILNIPFPIPPLAEQQRISAKIEESFVIVDRMFINKKNFFFKAIPFPQAKQESKEETFAIAAQGDDKGMNELLED